MNYKQIQERINELAEEILRLDFLYTLKPFVEFPSNAKMSSSTIDAYCPIHNDRTIGAFKINTSLNIAKCFSCNESFRNVISLLMIKGMKRNEAVVEAAYKIGRIEHDEYLILSGQKKDSSYNPTKFKKRELPKREIPKREIIQANSPADISIRNKIYSMLIKGNELIGKSKLTQKDYDYLKKERGLSDEAIQIGEFFSTPDKAVVNQILLFLKKNGIDLDILNHIPGFYSYKNTNQFALNSVQGIYFPVRNYKGEIEAIHRRNEKAVGKAGRYFWLSSSFTMDNLDKFNIGAKAETPIDVLYPRVPKEEWKPYVIIVEGKFKAIEVSLNSNAIVLSVQGVGNHKGIGTIVKELQDYLNISLKAIYISFDADMDENHQIFKQATSMTSDLSSNNPTDIYYYVWDSKDGKGIDDLIQKGKQYTLKVIERMNFEAMYGKILADCTFTEEIKEDGSRPSPVVNKELLFSKYHSEILKK